MNRTEAHPVELAIVAALVVIEALLTLVVAAVALVLVLAQWRRAAPAAAAEPIKYPSSSHQVAGPQPHPLATLATELQALPVAGLRAMAGTRSKSIRKAQLIEQVAACS